MTATYTIRGLPDVVDIATKLSHSWFRGQPRLYNNLTPKVFRADWDEIWGIDPQLELKFIDDFKRRAPGLSERVPLPDDNMTWLFLMQHHGAATRLLDWTESALVALFFAVEMDFGEDGELWALHPDTLNARAHVGSGFPLLNNPVLRFLANEPLAHGPTGLASSLSLPAVPDSPVALRPTTSFPRMVVQSSVFTIHPSPSHGKPIPDVLAEEEYLVRYRVPAAMKKQMLIDLWALRIMRSTLFPDLDSLSRSIEYEYQTFVAYTPPAPPRCGGPF